MLYGSGDNGCMGGGCADRRMLYGRWLWLGSGDYGCVTGGCAGGGCGGSAVGGGFMVIMTVAVL